MTQRQVTGDQARRRIDLPLSIKGVEKRGANLLGCDRQVIETIAALARQRRRRHVQISGKIERHGAVEKAAYGFGRGGPSAVDSLERLVESVRVGEDVMGGLPVRVLVGSPKARYPKRRRISKRSTEIGGRGPLACGSSERIDYFSGIVAEKRVGQSNVIRPIADLVAGREEVRQLEPGPLAQGDEVDRLAPRCAFLSTPSCSHLTDHARQHIGCMLPADDIETLESFVDEIERVAATRVSAVGLGGKQKICECSRRGAANNGRQHSSFRRIWVTHGHPAPQPTLQGGEIGLACERLAPPTWGRTIAIRSHAPRTVKQSQVRFLLRQER